LETRDLTLRAALLAPGAGVEAVASDIGLPCWVRPVGSESGAQCLRVDHEADLELRIGQASRHSSVGRALIQRADGGAVWRILGFKLGPDYVPVEAFEEEHTYGAYRVTRAMYLPGAVTAAAYVRVTELARKVGALLPSSRGLVEIEVVLTASGPRLADVRLRPYVEAGIDALLRAACGITLLDDALRVAVGGRPCASPCQSLAGALVWIPSDSGVLEAIDGVEEARGLPGVAELAVAARPGETLGHIVDEVSRDRVAHIVAVGRNTAEARARAVAASEALRLRTCRLSA
jgi:biotin carboxylase